MPQNEEVAVLAAAVERLTKELEGVTVELRRTNDAVKEHNAEARLQRDRMDRIAGEVWAGDNSSRIRTLELHIRGLYALVGFVALTIAGRLLPAFYQYLTSGN